MTFHKEPKQKSGYPGLLAEFDKHRNNTWIKGQAQLKSNQHFKTNFASFNRKSPK